MSGKSNFMNNVLHYIRVNGLFINPDQCRIYMRGLETINERMETSGSISEEIAKFLEKHSKVNRVMYPMLASHPTHEVNKRYLKVGPSVMLFHVNRPKFKSRDLMMQFFESTGFVAETSYGSAHSKLDPYSKMGKHNIHEYPKDPKPGKEGLWIRLAIGYESTLEEVSTNLSTLLDKCNNK